MQLNSIVFKLNRNAIQLQSKFNWTFKYLYLLEAFKNEQITAIEIIQTQTEFIKEVFHFLTWNQHGAKLQ